MQLPWYYGWNIIAVSLMFQALMFGTIFFSYTLWVGEWLDDASLGVSLTYVMVPITVLNLAQSFIAPLAGYAMDRYSIRLLVCTGAACAGAGYILIAQTSAFWQIVFIYSTFVMAGVLLAGPLAAQTLAAKWFDARRGLAIGISTTGTSIGGVLMPPVAALLYQGSGWRDAHLVLGTIFIVVIIPLVWLLVRSQPAEFNLAGEPAADLSTEEPVVYRQWNTLEIIRNRCFLITVLAFAPFVTVFGSIQQHLRPYAAEIGITAMETAFLVSVFSAVMIFGKLFFGVMADRIDTRRLVQVAVGACALVTSGLLTAPAYPVLVCLAGLLGFSAGGFLPLLGAIVASRFGPLSFGSVMGLLGPFLAVSALGPIIFAEAYRMFDGYDVILAASLFALAPAVIAIQFLPDRAENPEPGSNG